MKNLTTFVLACLLAGTTLGQENGKKPLLDAAALAPKIDRLAEQYTDLDIFSGVVLVAEAGKPVYHKAFGMANREQGIPNSISTRFDIGSMNKTFTKVVVLQLVSEGKLRLDDKLGKYLKGFPDEAAQKVTVEHLLNHRSGYGGYHDEEYWELPLKEKSIARAVQHIKSKPLHFEPGAEQEYSNAGYVLLGAIAEQASGKSYYDLVEERIVKPLGLENTFLRDKYAVENRAVGYLKSMKGVLENNDYLQEIPTPAGGFLSTTGDMLKFYRAYFYGGELWDEPTRRLDEMYSFYQQHLTSGGAMVQAGGFEGANTVHYEILRDEVSVIVFANMDEPVAEKLGAGILAIVRGKEPEKAALPALQSVYKAYKEQGIDYVQSHFDELTVNYFPDDPKDMILNDVGYNMLFSGEEKGAVEIFRLNTQLFPDIANCWDSYGESLLKTGNEREALKAYKKALEIRPDLESAREAVERLEKK